MTQLFDTLNYQVSEQDPSAVKPRHLTSVDSLPGRGQIWALDPKTVAAGRRGIARARQALRDCVAPNSREQHHAA